MKLRFTFSLLAGYFFSAMAPKAAASECQSLGLVGHTPDGESTSLSCHEVTPDKNSSAQELESEDPSQPENFSISNDVLEKLLNAPKDNQETVNRTICHR